jgi:FAD/FMN-containing dehydrogenase
MLSETTIAALKSELRGELIGPGDAGYDAARKVYNAMIDRKPRLIVRCADVADVIAALKFSREHKLPISVRGGGHNAAGSGVCDDGLVIDLSPIKYVRCRSEKHCLEGWSAGRCDHATHFRSCVPAGIISTTGWRPNAWRWPAMTRQWPL